MTSLPPNKNMNVSKLSSNGFKVMVSARHGDSGVCSILTGGLHGLEVVGPGSVGASSSVCNSPFKHL
jgi:hypothetical protein